MDFLAGLRTRGIYWKKKKNIQGEKCPNITFLVFVLNMEGFIREVVRGAYNQTHPSISKLYPSKWLAQIGPIHPPPSFSHYQQLPINVLKKAWIPYCQNFRAHTAAPVCCIDSWGIVFSRSQCLGLRAKERKRMNDMFGSLANVCLPIIGKKKTMHTNF